MIPVVKNLQDRIVIGDGFGNNVRFNSLHKCQKCGLRSIGYR